ncbi:terminase large subunit [Azospirillum sp. TSA2s]|nr:terminase large subunit [Azospirillum sp. TSA2s]
MTASPSAPTWTTACPDWERRIMDGESLIPCPPLFPAEAAEAMDWMKQLRIADVPGQPYIGECTRGWALDFAASIFGAYDPETGRRLITEFFLLISKKNTKSTIAAAIMVTALLRNWRKSAEFLILAPTVEVANNSYQPARDMVKLDPELERLLHVQDHIRTITHRETGATLKVVAADTDAVGGKKATGVLVDELHLFGAKPKAENMFREALGGLASRPEGFVVWLTTQSSDPPAGAFKTKLDYARKVRDGEVNDPRFMPVLYEFPAKMVAEKEYEKVENAWITNPNFGLSVDEVFLTREMQKAKDEGLASFANFCAKHLNVEVGLALRSDRWVGVDHWAAAADKSITLESILNRCEVVVGGIDGGGLDDLLGLAVLGREKGSRRWLLWSKAWAHETVLERRKSEAPRLRDLERAGDLVVVNDMEQAFSEVADILAVVDASGMLAYVGLDPMGVGAQVDALALVGIGGEDDPSPKERVVGISQGWTLNGAIKTAEIKLASGALRHAGQDLMAWAVGNAKTEPKGNAITITKAVAGTAKIDPLMAAFDAVALMSKNPEAPGSVYTADRGLTFF